MLALLVAQSSVIDPSVIERLGTAGAVAAVLGVWIWWLIKDRSRLKAEYDADVQAHRDQLNIERQENRALADRLVLSAERTAPILERAAQALELVARMAQR